MHYYNERLIFENLKKKIIEHKKYLEESIEETEKQLTEIDNIISEYKELMEKCDNFNKKINWCIAEHFNIKCFTQN